MRPLYGALPVPHVPVRVTRGAVIAHPTLMPLLAAESRRKGKGKVFYGQGPSSGESTTTECGFNY